MVIKEYTVVKDFNTRKGIVDEQFETIGKNAGKQYQGDGIQIAFGGIYNPKYFG